MKKKKREVDIVYLVDATGSMGPEIEAANQHVIKNFNDLKEKYNEQKISNLELCSIGIKYMQKAVTVILKEMNLDFFN